MYIYIFIFIMRSIFHPFFPTKNPGVQLRYWSKDQVQELFYALGISGRRPGGRAKTEGPAMLGLDLMLIYWDLMVSL
jgi:hypothetical protein